MSGLASPAAQAVVAVPAVAAVLGLLLARRAPRVAGYWAVTTSLVTLVVAAVELAAVHRGGARTQVATVGPLAVGELRAPLHLLADDLSAVVAVAVAVVGAAVQGFARWYLSRDARYPVFAATVSLFCAGMFLVVQSGDLILTLVGWEVMGWCSYLLIGHDSRRQSARRAAVKAFLVTRTADLAFVIGIIVLAAGAGSSDIGTVVRHWTAPGAGTGAVLTAALVCLLSGIAGKSAQFPFQDWLPDAMEGPTPASALIHAATMVAAGTYVLARLFDLFAASDTARLVLAFVTALTMVGAAVLAFGQSDLKRLLAWSTVSQIAIMLSALAVAPAAAGPGAGVLHLLSHAMFKALLFLALGWLSVLVGGTAAVTMSGGVRHHPALRTPIAIGLLSLAGVPPFAGFVSKEYVLAAAEEGARGAGSAALAGWVVLLALGLTVFLTAAYCTRAWLVLTHLRPEEVEAVETAEAEYREAKEAHDVSFTEMFDPEELFAHDEEEPHPAREDVTDTGEHVRVSLGARSSVGVLAFLSVVGGLVVLSPALKLERHFTWWVAAASLALIAVAALLVRTITPTGRTGDAAEWLRASVQGRFDRGFGVDRVYLAVVARPVLALARAVVVADRDVIDAYVRGTAVATHWAGVAGERAHTRKPSQYLVWLLLGLLAVGVAGVSLW